MLPELPTFLRHGETNTQPQPQPPSPTTTIKPPSPKHNRHRSFTIPSLLSRHSTSSTSPPQPTHHHTPSIEEETETSPYPTPHIGDPCTLASLDHLLTCTHKILTSTSIPEPCARNCHTRALKPDYAQPRDLDGSFACFACITSQLQKSPETGDVVDAIRIACEGLRISRPLWVESEFQGAVEEVLTGEWVVKEKVPAATAASVASVSVEGGAEVEEKRVSKGLQLKIPRYGGVFGRARRSTLGENVRKI